MSCESRGLAHESSDNLPIPAGNLPIRTQPSGAWNVRQSYGGRPKSSDAGGGRTRADSSGVHPPSTANHPTKRGYSVSTSKKFIEVALPLKAINKASAREKFIRHGHPSTLPPAARSGGSQ